MDLEKELIAANSSVGPALTQFSSDTTSSASGAPRKARLPQKSEHPLATSHGAGQAKVPRTAKAPRENHPNPVCVGCLQAAHTSLIIDSTWMLNYLSGSFAKRDSNSHTQIWLPWTLFAYCLDCFLGVMCLLKRIHITYI